MRSTGNESAAGKGIRAARGININALVGRPNNTAKVSIEACPRYVRCNAPLCPLDPDRELRSYSDGEPICGLALEAVKPGALLRLGHSVQAEVLAEVSRYLPDLIDRTSYTRWAFKRASSSAARADNLQREVQQTTS
jgi:hypothetical protein